ncbi:hypothetical protein CLOSBL3_12455 [Clostridiaceae bacterium BL-3]|nr:hypothetical protein CLOSBL3_12455 [Clostridiaceae bacterium BL-3]
MILFSIILYKVNFKIEDVDQVDTLARVDFTVNSLCKFNFTLH